MAKVRVTAAFLDASCGKLRAIGDVFDADEKRAGELASARAANGVPFVEVVEDAAPARKRRTKAETK